MNIVQLLDQMDELGASRRRPLVGASEEEIVAAEHAIGRRFPSDYRAFLARAGWDAGPILDGSEFSIGDFRWMHEGLQEALAEGRIDFTLGPCAHVFFMHQGYDFCFFHSIETDNPSVWQYCEGEMYKPEVVWSSFSHWLIEIVDSM